MIDEVELKPCPFCGGNAFQSVTGWTQCAECSAKTGTCIEWNTRPQPSETKGAEPISLTTDCLIKEGICLVCGNDAKSSPAKRLPTVEEIEKILCETNNTPGGLVDLKEGKAIYIAIGDIKKQALAIHNLLTQEEGK